MSANKRNLALMALLFISVTVIFLFRGDYAITLGFADEVLSVDGPQGLLFTADYADIASVRFAGSDFDRGEKRSGGEQYGYIYGEYENDALGRYTLCTQKKVSALIVVSTKDGQTIAFGCENDETMQNLYKAFTDQLAEKGYVVITD